MSARLPADLPEDLSVGDHITWNAPSKEPHAARRAAQISAYLVSNKRREDWLDAFGDDGIVEDPVGPSFFDPEAKGHHGREGIAAFWEKAIAMVDQFHFTIDDSFANGDTCANIGRITTQIGDTLVDTDLVMVYRVRPDGTIASMRAHWEPERAMATARKKA